MEENIKLEKQLKDYGRIQASFGRYMELVTEEPKMWRRQMIQYLGLP